MNRVEFYDPPLPILRRRFRLATEPNDTGEAGKAEELGRERRGSTPFNGELTERIDARGCAERSGRAPEQCSQSNTRPASPGSVGHCHACGAKLGSSPACWNCGAFNRGVGAHYMPPVSVGGILDINDEHPGALAPGAFVDSCLRDLADDIDRNDGRGQPKPDSGGLFAGFLCALGTVVLIAAGIGFFRWFNGC